VIGAASRQAEQDPEPDFVLDERFACMYFLFVKIIVLSL